MNAVDHNSYALLSVLAAPAILTNASTIITLSTSNRFGLAIDRAKAILAEMKRDETGLASDEAIQGEHLKIAERRVLLLVRALTVFYFSVASLSAATLAFLTGAILNVVQSSLWQFSLMAALVAAGGGVCGVALGCGILLGETWIAYYLLTQESIFRLEKSHQRRLRNQSHDAGKAGE